MVLEGKMVLYLTVFLSGIAAGGFLEKYLREALRKRGILSQYKMTGIVNGLLWLWVSQGSWTGAESLLCCLCASLLLAVAVVDARAFEIPLECNLGIGLLGAARVYLSHGNLAEYLVGAFAASGIFLAIFALTGDGIGGGDIKLMAAGGLFLGSGKILLALFIGSAVGLLCQLPLVKLAGKSRYFALGPYLALGIGTAMVYGDKIINRWL